MTHARTDYNIILNDGTELWVNQSPASPRNRPQITEIIPNESLVRKTRETLKELKVVTPLDLFKATQGDLDRLFLYAGGGTLDRSPQFRRGEIVSLVYINSVNGKRAVLTTVSIVSVVRA